jgi:hypothetical protein
LITEPLSILLFFQSRENPICDIVHSFIGHIGFLIFLVSFLIFRKYSFGIVLSGTSLFLIPLILPRVETKNFASLHHNQTEAQLYTQNSHGLLSANSLNHFCNPVSHFTTFSQNQISVSVENQTSLKYVFA